MKHKETTEALARKVAGGMTTLISDAVTAQGQRVVTVHNEDALRALLQVMVHELINCERDRLHAEQRTEWSRCSAKGSES